MDDTTTKLPSSDQGEGRQVGPTGRLLLDVGGFLAGVVLGLVFLGTFFGGHFLIALLALYFASDLGRRLEATQDRARLRPRLSAGALVLPTRARGSGLVLVFGVMAPLFLIGTALSFVQEVRQAHHLAIIGLVLGLLLGEAIGVLALVGVNVGIRELRIDDRGLLLRPDSLVINTTRSPTSIPWSDLTPADPLGGVLPTAGARAVLAHYLEHPESRSELGTEAALARAASITRTEQ